MVYFTCDACGSSLKKNQVEKHYNSQCRRCSVLTCMDCQKGFPGDTYKQHTSCISEAEKYSAKGWQPKANANKGLKKQNAWIESLQAVVQDRGNSLDKDVKAILSAIMTYDNIPRKRSKFGNFVKNIGKRCSPTTIDKTWEVFESAIKNKEDVPKMDDSISEMTELHKISSTVDGAKHKNQDGNDSPPAQATNSTETNGTSVNACVKECNVNQGVFMFTGTTECRATAESINIPEQPQEEKTRPKKRKEKRAELVHNAKKSKPNENSDNIQSSSKRFDWETAINEILGKSGKTAKGGIGLKKLKKKIFKKYSYEIDNNVTREELDSKLLKKLSKYKIDLK